MRAWRVNGFGEPADVLALEKSIELPAPGPDQLQVRVEAAGLGLPDVLMCRNDYPLVPPLPFTPSQEAVGEVVAVGEHVDTALIGTRVLGPTLFQAGSGGLAEQCLLIAPMALPVPDGMSGAEAAGLFIPFQTAWVGLVQRARLTADDSVLVLGAAGSSGSAAVQLAKAKGARVIAVAGGAQKVAFCEGMGADAVIDHHREDITARALELTGGRGVSVVYDPVGGKAGRAGFDATGFEGRFVIIGYASGEWPPISLPETLPRNISLLGAMPVGYPPEFTRHTHHELVSLWTRGAIRPGGQVFSFEQGREAIAAIAEGRTPGKVVVSLRNRE
jgi:NADPH2:quinone reductase